jgi:diguanylate cyclase (GGDEF)-like protein
MRTFLRPIKGLLQPEYWLRAVKNIGVNGASKIRIMAQFVQQAVTSSGLIDKLGFGSQFQLLRSFSVSSAIVMTLVTAVVVVAYQSNQTAALLRVAEDHNVALARSFANTVWARYSHYLSSVGHLEGDALRARPETAEIDRQLRQITNGLPVLKVKIFDLNGLTIYSSQFAQIGESRSPNPGFLEAARAAKPASKMSFRGSFSAFSGVLANVDLAESYVPIIDDAGKVRSVFELYTDITPHVASMRTDGWYAAVLSVLASCLVYLVLLLAVRRAHTMIRRHQLNEISSFNAMIETANAKVDVALKNMSQGLCMFDADERLVVANERYAQMYGLAPEQIKPGTPFRHIVEARIALGAYAGGDPEAYINERISAVRERHASTKIQTLPDGRVLAIVHQPLADGGWVATHEDITEQRRYEAKIAHMALHDGLTDLPNRTLFNERLGHALLGAKRGQMVAAHLLDLDLFKNVNDTLGHGTGDKLLQAVADRLRAVVRETDTVARMGGDEFAIVQEAIEHPLEAAMLADRVIAAVSEPYDIDGQVVIVGASVGIAIGPTDGSDSDQLIRNADLALYRAKGQGRGKLHFFEPGMDVQMQARRTLEYDMRAALPDGQFELHYQPVLNVVRNDIVGVEALIRWRHPERGMISPGEFIPLAEETGFIVPLGEWVIREACTEAARWPDGVKVAVNLSPAQFRGQGLVQVVINALASSGLAPGRLELEITETILLQDGPATLATLHRLRDLGVHIAMDDFGTGYYSLSYLRSFPFDKIKIDRSFVKDITASAGSLNIVRAVAAMAKGLGMESTAEGVETQEQLDAIRSEGCTEMQGFLFSRPLPARQIDDLLSSKHRPRKAATELDVA